jgi:hypothetical protein
MHGHTPKAMIGCKAALYRLDELLQKVEKFLSIFVKQNNKLN